MAKGVKLDEIKVSEYEISVMERDLMNYIMREMQQIENFWRYRHRRMMQLGIDVSSSVRIETEPGALKLIVEVKIPRELVVDLAKRRKRRALKFPKEHPLTRRAVAVAEKAAKSVEKALLSALEEYEEEMGE